MSPGLLVFDSFRHPPPGVFQLTLNPNLTLPLRLAFPSAHQLQPFHPQAKLGTASSPREPSRVPNIRTQHYM